MENSTLDNAITADSSKALDVIILSGQSNAVGYSRWDGADTCYEDVKMFRFGEGVVTESFVDTENLATAQWEILKNGLGKNTMAFGPEMGIGQVFLERYKTKRNDLGIIKFAVGGKGMWDYWLSPTSVEQHIGQWNETTEYPEDNGGVMKCGMGFRYIFETVRKAIKKATQQGYSNVNIIGMCWMQGEHDMGIQSSAKVYDKLLENFIKDIREILAADNLPVAVGQAKLGPAMHYPYLKEINDMQKKVCDEDGYAVLVRTDDLEMQPDDQAHYDTQSMKTLGLRFGNALAGLLG